MDQKGASVAVGNGRQTLFWDHNWATDQPLRNLAIHSIPEEIVGATVSEIWDESICGWNWDIFSSLLPCEILTRIAAHKIIEDPNVGNLYSWRGTQSRKFSIKNALRIICQDEDTSIDKKWEYAWTTPVQQRIRVFLWLVLHNKLLFNSNRVIRNLAQDPKCQRCGYPEVTIIHILQDCPIAKHVWSQIVGEANYPSFYTGDLSSWMVRNLEANGLIYSDKWPTCFAISLWWLWRWRNAAIFGRGTEIPLMLIVSFKHRSKTIGKALWRIMGKVPLIRGNLKFSFAGGLPPPKIGSPLTLMVLPKVLQAMQGVGE